MMMQQRVKRVGAAQEGESYFPLAGGHRLIFIIVIMPDSWMHLCSLVLLLSCTHINAKTVGQTSSPAEPVGQLPADVRSVVLKGRSYTDHVEVSSPINLTLQCTWTGSGSKVDNVTGYWSKDGEDIDNSHTTLRPENQQFNLQRMFTIKDEESLGKYSCMFGNEAKIDFVLAVPQISDVRDKPIISYVGDSVVMVCKMDDAKPSPKTWLWFKVNHTEKEEIDATAEPQRYEIKMDGKVTKLLVHNLTHLDSGLFHCGAVYAISTAMSHVELKVITIYEPLKPFVAIVVEVLVLVAVILMFERSLAKKRKAAASGNHVGDTEHATNAPAATTTTTTPQAEANGLEETTSTRQRKM
ncbi:embigin isoform X2 [Nerophis lumbriciformis]|uniref:embigin isoform X2 n=1 Tax=Nerophis lumbriciformis TaxID=546530 RepID=UPI002ADFF3F2|nr:embigin isoform X2 [Nerophis lumbriciformis]